MIDQVYLIGYIIVMVITWLVLLLWFAEEILEDSKLAIAPVFFALVWPITLVFCLQFFIADCFRTIKLGRIYGKKVK